MTLPWVLVMLGSLSPTWPIVSSAPVLPPLGFLIYLAWHQLRPGVFPIWAGLPLGLFDDLYSGQPLGSAVLLWSLVTIVVDTVEARFPWRGFLYDWVVAAALIGAYLPLSLGLANAAGASTPMVVILPQVAISILIFPLIGRLVGLVDRLRLLPVRVIE